MSDKLLALLIVGGIILIGALIWFFWWLTGVALDWANVRFSLGLTGTSYLVIHIIAFLVIGGFTGSSSGESFRRKD